MTVSISARRAGPFTTNGSADEFSFNFFIPTEDALKVVLVDGDGDQFEKIIDTDYIIEGVGVEAGGKIVFNEPPEVGFDVYLIGATPLSQPSDYKNQSSFQGKKHERSFDRLTIQLQELNEKALKADDLITLDYNAQGRDIKNIGAAYTDDLFIGGVNVVPAGLSISLPSIEPEKFVVGNTLGTGYEVKNAGELDIGKVKNSIAELKAVNSQRVRRAFVTGYYAAGDGGGGHYYHDAADTTSADNGGTIIVANDGARWKLIHNGEVDVRVFGAKADGTTNNSTAIEAMKDAGVVAVFNKSGGSYLINDVVIDADFEIKMNGGQITSGSIDSDVFSLSANLKVTGFGSVSLCRSFVNISEAAPVDLDIIFDCKKFYVSNCHDLIVGNKAVATAAGDLRLSGLRLSDVELGVFTRDIGWTNINIYDVIGNDFKLKPLTSRPAGNKFNQYYVSGILIDAQGYDGSATVSGCIFRDIYNAMVDPVTLAVVPPGDVENHGIAIETDGSVTMDGNNVENVSANLSPQDVEGIVARGREITVSGNTLYDAGDDEGCIYTKGSSYGSVTGNTVIFSTMAANTNEKFGLVVSGKDISVSGNTFVNCGRGVNLRAGVKLGWNTYISCVAAVFNGIDTASEILSVTGAFKNCTTVVSNINTAAITLVQIVDAEIELPVAGKIMNTLSASSLISNYVVKGCAVIGTNTQTVNELILFQANNDVNMTVANNDFFDVKHASTSLSVIRVSSNPNNIRVKNNNFDGANECIRLRDRTYANLICTDNTGFDLTGSLVNSTAITVTGTNVVARNNA